MSLSDALTQFSVSPKICSCIDLVNLPLIYGLHAKLFSALVHDTVQDSKMHIHGHIDPRCQRRTVTSILVGIQTERAIF